VAGCTASATPLCEQAAEHVAGCLGDDEWEPSPTCNEADAERVLRTSCDDLASTEGKADFVTNLWCIYYPCEWTVVGHIRDAGTGEPLGRYLVVLGSAEVSDERGLVSWDELYWSWTYEVQVTRGREPWTTCASVGLADTGLDVHPRSTAGYRARLDVELALARNGDGSVIDCDLRILE
jgi:hypothetical protein